MKKLPFLLLLLLVLCLSARAQQSHRAAIRSGHGAVKPQELGQAVFSAMQQNQFGNVQQYLPDETELKVLSRRSSEDMKALLKTITPDSIKQELQREFRRISEESTANAFNWQDWQAADTKLLQRDPRNRLLYSMQVTMADPAGAQKFLVFEAIKVRNRYFLFRKIEFRGKI